MASRTACRWGSPASIVQSQALFTVGVAAVAIPARAADAAADARYRHRRRSACSMICGTVGYDFSVGAFAVLMIAPICFAVGNLLLRARAVARRCSTCSPGSVSPPPCRCSRWRCSSSTGRRRPGSR